MSTDEMVAVTQEVREAFQQITGKFGPMRTIEIDRGDSDGDWRMQILARLHRAGMIEGMRRAEGIAAGLQRGWEKDGAALLDAGHSPASMAGRVAGAKDIISAISTTDAPCA